VYGITVTRVIIHTKFAQTIMVLAFIEEVGKSCVMRNFILCTLQ